MNREKLLMTLAAVVFGLMILDKALVAPLTASWKERAKKINYLNLDVTKGRQLVARERAIRERWREMRANALPASRSESESAVLNRVDEWSRAARLKPSQILPRWTAEDDHARLNCRLEATGDMEAVMRFLYDLDGEQLALRVESFDLSTLDKQGRNLQLDLTLSGLELPRKEEAR
jgi:hypothetical protein